MVGLLSFLLFILSNLIWVGAYITMERYFDKKISNMNERWYKHCLETNDSWTKYLNGLTDGFYKQTGQDIDFLNQRLKEINDILKGGNNYDE